MQKQRKKDIEILAERIEQLSKQVSDIVPQRIIELRSKVETLSNEIQSNDNCLKRVIREREELNQAANRKLHNYVSSLQVFDFDQAEKHIETAGFLKRQTVKLSEVIGMILKRTGKYQTQAKRLGTAAADILSHSEYLAGEATSLLAKSKSLLTDINNMERDLKSLRKKSKEES